MTTEPSQTQGESRAAALLAAIGLQPRKNAAPPKAMPDTAPAPAHTGTPEGALDSIRTVFWESYRHLFPTHALVTQTGSGAMVVSWSMSGDPHARFKYASPVVLRFEPELIAMMESSPHPEQRKRIAARQEPVLRAGMIGYDPYAGAQARIIVLG